MKNFLKGFVIGIGKIIPGVSGAILAISMGIYDKAIDYICNFNNNKKESIKYLFPIGFGIITSIIFFSKIISLFLAKYYIITMFFFVGLIIGGVPTIKEKVNKKDYYIVFVSFIIFFFLSISNIDNVYIVKNNFFDYFIFFLSGIVEALGTVVPGISSTALLMIMGTYSSVIGAIGNIDNTNILIPFIIGTLIGILITVRIINFLFKKYDNKLYAFVLGILLSSIVLLVVQTFKYGVNFIYLVIGLMFMMLGIFISCLLDRK